MVNAPASIPSTPVELADVDVEAFERPRPKDVGILAMEMYFPRRVSVRAVFVSSSWCARKSGRD